jgi:hypothetical protein
MFKALDLVIHDEMLVLRGHDTPWQGKDAGQEFRTDTDLLQFQVPEEQQARQGRQEDEVDQDLRLPQEEVIYIFQRRLKVKSQEWD